MLAAVADTEEEAKRRAYQIAGYVRTQGRLAPQFTNPPGYVPVAANISALRGTPAGSRTNDALREVTLEQQREAGVVMYGTPDQVVAQIKREYERVGGFDHLLMMMQAGFLDHKRTVSNINLFAKEVYPQIRNMLGTRALMGQQAAE